MNKEQENNAKQFFNSVVIVRCHNRKYMLWQEFRNNIELILSAKEENKTCCKKCKGYGYIGRGWGEEICKECNGNGVNVIKYGHQE